MKVSGIVIPVASKDDALELAGSAWTRDTNTYLAKVAEKWYVVLEFWR